MSLLSDGLARLGLTYKEYLRSDHWLELRERYYRCRSRECWVCGSTASVDLHHVNYARLGAERLNDLVPLCREHHDEFHKTNPGLHNLRKRSKKFIKARSAQELPKGMKRSMNGKIRLRTKNPSEGAGLHFATLETAKVTAERLKKHVHVARAKTVSLEGPPCKRCGNAMVIVKHPPNWSPKTGKAYYSFWYKCSFKKCKTTLVMPPKAYRHSG